MPLKSPICALWDALGEKSRKNWVSEKERPNAPSQVCPKSYEFGLVPAPGRKHQHSWRLSSKLEDFGLGVVRGPTCIFDDHKYPDPRIASSSDWMVLASMAQARSQSLRLRACRAMSREFVGY